MPRIGVNDIEIYYELSGPDNAPVLVLSNGIMMSTASWAYQKAVLNQYLRVLLYDCRGMWQSDHPDEAYSMEQHAEDLSGLLNALEIESAHIGGISYGAEISMVFALNYPEKTDSLIIIDGVSEIHPLLKAQTYPWLMAAERGDPELLLRTSYHMNFSEMWIKANREFIEKSVDRFAQIDMQALAHLMRAFFDLDITERLSEIHAPTMIIAGEADLIKGREYAEIIANQIPSSEFVLVPGAGHALCLEKPAVLNSLLLGFVQKHANLGSKD
jgi:3-oxoadipate enol-lactonase